VSFVLEGAVLALLGGVLGCAGAFYLHGFSTGTIGFNTFSEIVFQFRITPLLVAKGLAFSVCIGVLGSLLPALRASRLPVISALNAV
jgi:putative ABC transport system permease protein